MKRIPQGLNLPLFIAAYLTLACVLFHPTIHGADGYGNYAPLRSLLFDHDLDFRNDYRLFDSATAWRFSFAAIPLETATKRPGDRYGIGSAILWAPFVALVRCWDVHTGISATGLEARYVHAVGWASVFWGGLGLLLLFMYLLRNWGTAAAWMGASVAIGASPLAFYLFFHTSMSHATGFFAATALMLCWERALRTQRWGWFLAAGLFSGLTVMIRFQDAALVMALFAFAGIYVVMQARSARALWPVIAAGIFSLLVFSPQMIVWRILYGSYFSGPAPYLRYSEFSLLRPIHALQTLFSSNHGLFWWHPLLAIGAAGLITGLRRNRIAAGVPLLALLATWYICSCWQVWFAGASFGNRFYISVLLGFASGWAILAQCYPSRRAHYILWTIIALGCLWNAGLAVQYGTGMIPRQGTVSFARVLENQFRRVPGKVLSVLFNGSGLT